MMPRFRLPAAALALCMGWVAWAAPATAGTPLKPDDVLAKIRQVFRAHRPPPPYISYTVVREQLTEQGYPDYVGSYTYHVWCRSSDRAALGRKVFRDDARGPLEFMRPAFNEPRDPGPPTADVFERAPAQPQSVETVPTPEPVGIPAVIGSVTAYGELEYHVLSVTREGDVLHLRLTPIRSPQRNRLREIYADAKTYELRKLVATDRLFLSTSEIYGVIFTVTMGTIDGRLVVTDAHGKVVDNYVGDGEVVDFHFKDIKFPGSLPDWYFDAHAYGSHENEAPL